jgi:hypothetical protein
MNPSDTSVPGVNGGWLHGNMPNQPARVHQAIAHQA